MARRRKSSPIDDMASLPWPIGIALGLIGFAAVRWGPAVYFRNAGGTINTAIGDQFANGALAPLAWVVLGLCWIAAAVSYLRSRQRRALLDVQTGLDSMRGLSWRQFEQLVGESLRRQGYAIEETGQGGADGGVDLVARRSSRTVLVQCKQWRRQQVGVSVVREMWGLVAHHRADGAMIYSVGEFTPDAASFAAGKPVELVTGVKLLDAINTVRSATSERALSVTPQSRAPSLPIPPAPTPPQSPAPNCPQCTAAMVLRPNRSTGAQFWGCSNYPRCRGTRSV